MGPVTYLRRLGMLASVALGTVSVPVSLAVSAEMNTETGDGVSVQLNKMEDVAGGCRTYLVLENRFDHGFETYKMDLVMFGRNGGIIRRLAVDAGPMAEGKTLVKLFDVPDTKCERIDRLLLNQVMTCKLKKEGRAINNCTPHTYTDSRLKTSFIK